MENGLFSGEPPAQRRRPDHHVYRFITAMVEGGANQWAILGGNAQSGSLSTDLQRRAPHRATTR